MIFRETSLNGAFVVETDPVLDSRGWFARVYDKKEFSAVGHNSEWVQMNASFTNQEGTLRGMHFQYAPFSEAKLIRCIAGNIYDVIVDIRPDSPSFLQWYSVELSASNRLMMFVPSGFAHGFQSLTADCELLYCHSSYYTPGHEGAIKYDDPMLNIAWPLKVTKISDRDLNHPFLTPEFKGITRP